MPSLTTLSSALRKAYISVVTSATDGRQSLFRLPNTEYGSMVKTQIDFSATNTKNMQMWYLRNSKLVHHLSCSSEVLLDFCVPCSGV